MCCDRISDLPDSLLIHILSDLSTKESVKTSVLSKRWELLWLQVSGLDINTVDDFLPYGEALLSFMNRFLEFNRGSSLQTFKMKYCRYAKIGYDASIRLVEWIPELVHRRIQHLDLENEVNPRVIDIMPDCIYVSKTLVTLKLVCVGLKDLKFAVSLPCLKTIHLERNYILYHVAPNHDVLCADDYFGGVGRLIMENLISGSPVLENFTLFFGFGEKEFSSSWTNVPQCLSSTLEYVEMGVNIMRNETGIKLVKYFLENSAVLKKLTLSCKDSLTDKRQAESYEKLLTSTKLSPRCQVLVDWYAASDEF